MEKFRIASAVHQLQLALLEGIKDENKLYAAGSLMSRSDYEDVVTERSIDNICGYPLCRKSLPSDRPRKGRYRISLKEHKVYDLHETHMYCSSCCLVGSRLFAESLQEKRCSDMSPRRIEELLKLFEDSSSNSVKELEKNGDFGLSDLKIQEKVKTRGEVSFEEWIGPADAIEGYVPQNDRNSDSMVSETPKEASGVSDAVSVDEKCNCESEVTFKSAVMTNEKYRDAEAFCKEKSTNMPSPSSASKQGSKVRRPVVKKKVETMFDGIDFTSTIITQDEYTISKPYSPSEKPASVQKPEERKVKVKDPSLVTRHEVKKPARNKKTENMFGDIDFTSTIITQDDYTISETLDPPEKPASSQKQKEIKGKVKVMDSVQNNHMDSNDPDIAHSVDNLNSRSGSLKSTPDRSINGADIGSVNNADELNASEAMGSSKISMRSSLKGSGKKNDSRTVTWADQKSSSSSKNCHEDREAAVKDSKSSSCMEKNDESYYERFSSAEACALALNQAAEAVTSGKTDATDAVSEAGIILLPLSQPHENENKHPNEANDAEKEQAPVGLPKKSGFFNADPFASEDSWVDTPPEGFTLTLSPFATMFNALFTWISSSSLSYIYGKDESCQEKYMSVNGKEYPQKTVLSSGQSSEIKQTLARCLSSAIPGVNDVLKLPVPIYDVEKQLGLLLETMSFVDPLPPFRHTQWHAVTLLFIEALSVCKIPAIAPLLASRRMLMPKILNSAQISFEEYEIMKDFILPLGRGPQLLVQSE